MKVFISSVVQGFKEFRSAAKDAVETLDLSPIMSEHFGARPYSSQQACLTEIDQCDVYLLILGAHYGYEQEPNISVTQQEFRQAIFRRKPILVFVQKTNFDDKQVVFVNEVSDYKQGFFRASFSDAAELTKLIIQGLSRLEKAKNAISEKEFLDRFSTASITRAYGTSSYAPKLEFAFLPQPAQQHMVHSASRRRDEIFQTLHQLGLAQLRKGYEDWDDKTFTGLKSGDTSWRVFEDGLVIIEADANVPQPQHSIGLYFVPPSRLIQLFAACFEVATGGSGWYRIGLSNLEMAKIEEPPTQALQSYSMPMRRDKTVYETQLFIPATTPAFERWAQESVIRMARSLEY